MQQVQIEMIRAEAGEAGFTGAQRAISGHMIGLDFRNQEHAVTLPGDCAADQFLGTALAVILGRVD